MRMRRALSVAAVVTAVAMTPAASRASAAITWEAINCDEVTLIVPANPAASGLPAGTTSVTILVYRCERGTIGDSVVAPFIVSEIGAITPGGLVLLREVSNSVVLFKRLSRLGVPARYSSDLALDVVQSPAGIATATVDLGRRRYSVTAAAVPDPEGTPSSFFNGPGASYRTSGRKGTVIVSYENRFDGSREGPGAAVGTVDASRDPELARWMGTSRSAGPGLYLRGDWTGTARPAAR